jgi:uncharacterized protein YpmS
MRSTPRRPGLILLALSVCALACLPCQTTSQVVPTPERTVPVSTEEAQDLVSALGQGIVLDSDGRFVLVITEEELTSFMALNMEESIVDPQVLLTQGQIHMYGTMVSPIEAPLTAVASIQVNSGRVHMVIESVSVGGYPIPETFVQAFAQQIDDFVTAATTHEEVEIAEVEIREGEIIIRGESIS